MTYRALLEYIREAKTLGVSDHEIKARLTSVGWYTVDVQDAMHLYGTLTQIQPTAELARTPTPRQRGPKHYDPHLVAVAALAFAVGFVGYLLIAAL